jgi:hypothetical protein
MLKYLRIAVTALSLTACVLVIYLSYHAFGPTDGIVGEVLALIYDDQTVWPITDYSDNGFRAVRIGMSRGDVYSLIGRPINMQDDPDGIIRECWTWSGRDGSYRKREVIFRGNEVIGKVAGFEVVYID